VRVRRAIIGRRGVGGSACFGVPGASHAVGVHWLVGLRGVDGVVGPVAGRVTGPGGFAGGVVIAIAVVVADVAALGLGPGVRRFRVVGGEVGGVAVLRAVGAGDPAHGAVAAELQLRFELAEILELGQRRQFIQALEAE